MAYYSGLFGRIIFNRVSIKLPNFQSICKALPLPLPHIQGLTVTTHILSMFASILCTYLKSIYYI